MPRPIALVTGASSGIGAAYAERLAHDHDLILVARRRERLEALAERLRPAHVEVLVADLTDRDALATVCRRAAGVALLVNNAGFAGYRPFHELEPRVADELIDVHMRAAVQLSRAAVPEMVARGAGGIINVASLLALSGSLPPHPMPHRAVYAGAKAFLLTFSETLAGEVGPRGVKVQVCLPGVVATEFHDQLNLDRERLRKMAMSPEKVVQASLAALARSEVVCVPGLDDPSLLDRLTETQRAILMAGNRPEVAERYRGGR